MRTARTPRRATAAAAEAAQPQPGKPPAATESMPEQAPPAKARTVRMTRDAAQHPAPHSADVHPAEVANWEQHGWARA